MTCLYRAGFALAIAFTAVFTFAAGAASIHGTVRDPLGAVVPQAQVELFRDGVHVATVATDAQGNYRFTSIAPGRYQVRAQAPNFAAQTSDSFYAGSGAATADLTLKIGAVAQQIVVSATGTRVPESQVGAPVNVITAGQFENKLETLEPLRQVPGVQVLQSGQRGVSTSLFIRGGNSTANKILLDGVPASEIGGTVDFGNVFTTGIDQIEVLRGPNSVLYGADALAGVVNLTTRRGTTRLPQISYAFSAGNFGSLNHDGSVGGTFKQFDYFGEFSRFDTRNSEPNATFHNATFAGNAGWTPNASNDLRLTVRRVAATTGVPNAIEFFGIPDDSFQSQHNTYISATYQNRTTENWHNLVRYGAVRVNSEFVNPSPSGTFDPISGNFLGNTLTIRGANGFSTTGQAILDFAGPYPQQFFIPTNRDFVDVQSDYAFSHKLTALFGFRYDNERAGTLQRGNFSYTGEVHGSLWNRLYGTLGVGLENNAVFGTAATPRASLAYYLVRPRATGRWNGTRLKANYGQGIKEPDGFSQNFSLFALLSQLPGGDQLISQFHIRPIGPERARSFDLGLDQFAWNSRARLSAIFFYNRFTDQIEDVSGSGLLQLGVPQAVVNQAPLGATVNSEATRAFGAETELELDLGRGLTARAAYTYLDAVVQRSFSSDELFPSFNPAFPTIPIGAFSPLVGNRPFNRAPHTASFVLGYTRHKYTLTLSGNIVTRRDGSTFLFDPNFGATMLLPNHNLAPGYHRIDFSGTYRASRRLEFFSGVENLASQHYDGIVGFPALPLNFRVGVKVTVGGEGWK
ncbi:MAG: TonB-dependent receptor [Acidobacteriia bacterium]|nr:TonB-dependent receptor [Terriglobia bacterium]